MGADEAYRQEYEAIAALMTEVGDITTANMAAPDRLHAAEQELGKAGPELQERVAADAGLPVETLRAVLAQSFASIIMQHSEHMLNAGLATNGLFKPAPHLAPLRSVAEKLLASVQARQKILAHLAEDHHGLLDNIVIVYPR